MIAIQRQEAILELLNKKQMVRVHDLVERFKYSEVTIRKDLNLLQKKGLIVKTHGGAVLAECAKNLNPNNQPNHISHTIEDTKEQLAGYMYTLIQPGDTIFLGSGSTCSALADYIQIEDNISIITNNIDVAKKLHPKCKTLILLGGEVVTYGNQLFTASNLFNELLMSYNINKSITSCSAIDMTFGISVSTEVSSYIYSCIIKKTENWFIVADSTKFNHVAPYKVAEITKPQCIITNELIPEYNKLGNVITVS